MPHGRRRLGPPGLQHLEGREAFDEEIENEAFDGPPSLTVDRLVEDGDTVVAIGAGQGRRKDWAEFRFAFVTVLTFRDGAVCRVESYVLPLTPANAM